MIRSLYAGVSGMKNHQVRMDVIGNNIANVNTTAYKAGRANFQDTLYQTIKGGGNNTNHAQTGLGVGLAAISSNMNSGGLTSTGRTLDLAINGSGFFKVTDGTNDYYTRDGVFHLTDSGDLVNSNGLQVKGEVWDKAEITGTKDVNDSDTVSIISTNGTLELQSVISDDGTKSKITEIELEAGMTLNQVVEAINAKTSESGVVASVFYDDTNSHYCLKLTTVYNGYPNEKVTDKNTLFVDPDGNSTIDLLDDLGLSSKQSDAPSKPTEVDIAIDNIPVASLNIQNNGIITGTDTEGNPLKFGNMDVARITLWTFRNQDGLKRVGSNLFEAGENISGDGEAGTPGTSGYGTIESGYIETSNVDLTDQFTDMITTQRGYQAGARIITVSDTMLEELINLKR